MSTYFAWVTMALLVVLLVGLWRVLRGPDVADRMLAAQLFGTAGVAVLIVLAVLQQQAALLNAALVLALLAPLTLITFVSLGGRR